MSNQQLNNYIKTGLSKGYKLEDLRDNLLKKGYNAEDVDGALKAAGYNIHGTLQSNSKISGSRKAKKQNSNRVEKIVQPLGNYIKTGLSKGYKLEDLRDNLLQNGYDSKDVDEAINLVNSQGYESYQSSVVSQQENASQDSASNNYKHGGGADNKNPVSSSDEPYQGNVVSQQENVSQDSVSNNYKPEGGADNKNSVSSSDEPNIKRRNPAVVILLSIITLGIYGIYWVVSTTKELRRNTNSAPNPKLLLLFFIPGVNLIIFFVYYWKYSQAINELTGFSAGGLFVLWFFIAPVAMIVSQLQLNKKVDDSS